MTLWVRQSCDAAVATVYRRWVVQAEKEDVKRGRGRSFSWIAQPGKCARRRSLWTLMALIVAVAVM